MCGITGFWTPDGVNLDEARTTVTAMAEALRHRGPDDEGVWIDPDAGLALGFRRLAILDLTPTGRQPMESASGRFVIVFNGEIYNHHALRRELAGQGHAFRGRSDTEVLLEAVEAWGMRRTLEQCNGMFAFAVWDKAERSLHLARDRAGEKPLYYGWMGRTLLFGSELKALRAHPAFRPQIDRNAVALYLRRGYVPGPYSIFLGVNKLRPGSWLTVRPDRFDSGVTPTFYWSPQVVAEQAAADPFRGDAGEAGDVFHELLTDAVKLRMEADVPLGAFLSGGLDSSAIVALMQAHSSTPVRTFTIGFRDERYNEAHHAAAVARHLGTEHTELYLTPAEALAVIPRLPVLYDEPFADTSQIPTYLVSELTRRHVTVSLSGDAGDELFGGYRRHRLGPAIWSGIRWLPLPLRRGLAALIAPRDSGPGDRPSILDRLSRPLTGKRNLVERLRQATDILPLPSAVALYNYMMSYWKDPTDLLPGAREMLVPATDPARWPDLGTSPERVMMFLDAVAYLPDDILVKLDRASMATSLETRIPLLDHRVIEFAWRLPLAIRLRHGTGAKWPIRQVLYRYVPRELVDRPKRGFHMPVGEWLRGPLRDWADSLLDDRRLRHGGTFDPRPIRKKWAEHLAGTTRWDYHLWTVLMFESWLEANSQIAQAVPA